MRPQSFRPQLFSFACFLIVFSLSAPVLGQESSDNPAAQDTSQEPVAQDSSEGPTVLTGPVFVVPITGMIDKALAVYIDRAVADAEASSASAIIFHIDTFGGLVDAADQIRQTILNTEINTIAFIEHNAASAGALISYAADTIIMAPGSSIGAATVVEGSGGDAAPDKYQSYMKGMMRTTAEANGRDPDIAEAMVDQDIELDGISEAGKVLTLSTVEALELGVADAEAKDLDDVYKVLNLDSSRTVLHETSLVERVLRFFGSPVVQSVLMLMMMGGLYFELQTPGVGFAGLMAALGAALFFGPHYMMGLVESWELVLFVAGVALILMEIFVVPGFGITGIAGIIILVFSLGVSLIGNVGLSFPAGPAITSAVWTLAITLLLLIALMISLGKYAPRSNRFGQLILAPELSSAMGFTAAESHDELIGKTGTALTALRPAGTALVDELRIDVVTSGEYITSGTDIRVVSVKGSRIEVRAVA